MKLNAPSQPVWLIALILGVLGIISHTVRIRNVSPYAFSLLAIGFVLLLVATVAKRF